MALMLFMGAGVATAQDCCKQGEQKEQQACCEKGGKAAIENIMTRTSIRKFKQQPVEKEKVETMLRAAMAAPTAMNKQPWHFVVVDDKQVLDQLAGPGRRGDMLRNAPLAIAVCGDMTKAIEGDARDFWIEDTSAAMENLLLAAHALGLGAVWTGCYPIQQRCEETRSVLGLPETIVVMGVAVIGYPDEQPTPKDKWKPENVSYNKYGEQQ